jgi:hypothetical protein
VFFLRKHGALISMPHHRRGCQICRASASIEPQKIAPQKKAR